MLEYSQWFWKILPWSTIGNSSPFTKPFLTSPASFDPLNLLVLHLPLGRLACPATRSAGGLDRTCHMKSNTSEEVCVTGLMRWNCNAGDVILVFPSLHFLPPFYYILSCFVLKLWSSPVDLVLVLYISLGLFKTNCCHSQHYPHFKAELSWENHN